MAINVRRPGALIDSRLFRVDASFRRSVRSASPGISFSQFNFIYRRVAAVEEKGLDANSLLSFVPFKTLCSVRLCIFRSATISICEVVGRCNSRMPCISFQDLLFFRIRGEPLQASYI